jgi:hypothetical protein
MEINTENFPEFKEKTEESYKKIGEVFCPYLKDRVSFNAKGLDHIKFKEWDKARGASDQYMRLRLIDMAPRILKESHTLQEFYETQIMQRQKINSRWERRLMKVRYYGFVAIINSHRLKVIVKEIEGGNKFFWSLIPFWKTRKNEESGRYKKILHEGDLEVE